MSKTKFWINWSIDCEATQHSVNDAGLGLKGARGYADILDANGMKGTFFIIPKDAESNPDFYRSLTGRGHETGLHLHPGDEGYFEFAGVMGPEEQHELVSVAKDRWSQAMGFEPVCFCMGYASANDYTYGVLEDLGFRHGQVGLPGRRLPETASVWEGEPLYIHYTNRYNRLLPGDMDFVDVPHTVDIESYMWGGKHPQDLRVELVDAKNHWYTAYKSVMRQKDDETIPVKVIRGVTHNTFDYTDPDNFRRQTLLGMIDGIKNILEDADCECIPATVGTIVEKFRETVPKIDAKKLLKLDRRGYQGKKTV
ncbi:MAG: polysaccharide deacetylase family protein [Candidatus Latescibacteria bacterium]|nr:polysaccharide deacetylase family protein [Candidatus Latescibacterota bacterium]